MVSTLTKRLHTLWSRANSIDLAALAVLILSATIWAAQALHSQERPGGFLIVLAVCALGYFLVRGGLWAKDYLLWSLRNRLITAYLFIAVVPILLLLVMAGLAAYLLYWQLGSYVLYSQMQDRINRLGAVTLAMVTSYAVQETSGSRAAALVLPVDMGTYLKNAMTELPGLKVEQNAGEDLLRESKGPLKDRNRGLVIKDGVLSLQSVTSRQTPSGRVMAFAIVPVTPELLETLATELGPIQVNVLRLKKGHSAREVSVVSDREAYESIEQIRTPQRSVPQAVNVFDKLITGIISLDVLDLDQKTQDRTPSLVIASFSTRPSLLDRRLFSPLGELGGVAATALLVVGAVFLFIEFGSLVTGIIMTRTITSAVDDLYRATQHVQAGDLAYRVRVKHRDQLAALGESFNSMIHSVSELIEEQRKRQKLENELSIAHEVQLQLFPHTLPKLPGVELEAICRAARTVSGDYYDFIRISPTCLVIALGDISGKGISAALLMANVQAALRSDVLRYRNGQPGNLAAQIDTAEVVAHLNRHLFRNTSEERYATFFLGVYDEQRRKLSYTNAGHLAPLYICGNRIKRLETGGMVVGLFSDVPFEQGTVEIEPGSLLVAYSDGLTESPNASAEEFGSQRLIDVAMQHKDESPHVIAEAMMQAAQEWSGSPEQADDMTVIVARFSPSLQETLA